MIHGAVHPRGCEPKRQKPLKIKTPTSAIRTQTVTSLGRTAKWGPRTPTPGANRRPAQSLPWPRLVLGPRTHPAGARKPIGGPRRRCHGRSVLGTPRSRWRPGPAALAHGSWWSGSLRAPSRRPLPDSLSARHESQEAAEVDGNLN